MSLFHPDFSTPGRGVDINEPKPTGINRFFTIFSRRLIKFVQINLIFMIPFIFCLLLMAAIYMLPVQRYSLELNLADNIVRLSLWNFYMVPLPLIMLMPFYFGVVLLVRRLINEEYVFVWSEYWIGVKDNFLHGLINGVLSYVAYVVFTFAVIYYANQLSAHWYNFIPLAMVCVLILVFLLAELYLPIMSVSVKLKFFPLLKNAAIFGIMGLVKNLIVLISIFAVLVACYYMQALGLTILLVFILFVFIGISFVTYFVGYITYPIIESYIINPSKRTEKVSHAPEVQQNTENFEYEKDELDYDEPEYVYFNGKMIPKEEFEKLTNN